MHSLNSQVARTVGEDRRRVAALHRSVAPPGPQQPPPRLRRVAVLAARIARRLDAEAARNVLRA